MPGPFLDPPPEEPPFPSPQHCAAAGTDPHATATAITMPINSFIRFLPFPRPRLPKDYTGMGPVILQFSIRFGASTARRPVADVEEAARAHLPPLPLEEAQRVRAGIHDERHLVRQVEEMRLDEEIHARQENPVPGERVLPSHEGPVREPLLTLPGDRAPGAVRELEY